MCGRQKTNREIHDQLIIDFSIQRDLYLSLSLLLARSVTHSITHSFSLCLSISRVDILCALSLLCLVTHISHGVYAHHFYLSHDTLQLSIPCNTYTCGGYTTSVYIDTFVVIPTIKICCCVYELLHCNSNPMYERGADSLYLKNMFGKCEINTPNTEQLFAGS